MCVHDMCKKMEKSNGTYIIKLVKELGDRPKNEIGVPSDKYHHKAKTM